MTPKYIVVSPPRSGTSSICKMARMCNLRSLHVLNCNFYKIKDRFDLFADTPFYSPEFLIGLINSGIYCKFIYIDRDVEEIKTSMSNIGIKDYMKMDNVPDEQNFKLVNDFFAWNSLRCISLENHKDAIKLIARTYDIPILFYNFSMGWNPFCEFINAKVPSEKIPHLNKNKIGESYV